MTSHNISQGSFDRDFSRKLCEKICGPYIDKMIRDYRETKEFLKHSDPRARLGALFMIREYWKPQTDFGHICEQLAMEDPDVDVRSGALSSLCGICYGTQDGRIGRVFATLVLDGMQPVIIRRIAYFGLFSLQGFPSRVPNSQTFKFPDDVDWTFVRTFFLQTNEG